MKLYISGPHAVGKTSTCEQLHLRHPDWWKTEYDDERQKPQDHTNLFDFEDLYRRQLWRCLVYAKDELLFYKLEKIYSGLIIDRHPIENLIYSKSFYEMGWISFDEYYILEKTWDTLFTCVDPVDILILPPIEWEMEKITRPKNTPDREAYKEDDWEYLRILRHNYMWPPVKTEWKLVIVETDVEKRIEIIEDYLDKKQSPHMS